MTRFQHSFRIMALLGGDLRTSLRAWRARPFLTAVVVLTLALGISATAVVFAVVDAVLLAPLPYAAPDRLVVIRAALPGQQRGAAQLSGPEVHAVVNGAKTLQAGGAIWARPGVIGSGSASATEIEVGWISPGFLEALGRAPHLGRLPSAEEHMNDSAIVLSYELWQQRFGGDAAIIGRRIDFDDEPRTVVGVMPAGFRMYFPPEDGVPSAIEAWLPWGSDPRELARALRVFTVVGRLDDAAARPALETELRIIAADVARESSDYARSGFALSAVALPVALTAPIRPLLFVLSGVVAIVFVVACANVANLLLIRTTERSTEFAVRLALGAGKGRLWRQIVVESVVLGGAAGAAGAWLAMAIVELLGTYDPAGIPRAANAAVNARTLLVAAAGTVAASVCLGSLAARHGIRSAGRVALGSTRGTTGRALASRVLVAGQVMMASVLLCAAGLLARSVVLLYAVDPGFDPSGVLSTRLSLPDVRYPYSSGGPAIGELYRQLDERLAELPGVIAVGSTISPPLSELPLRPRPYAYRLADGEVEWGSIAADYRTVTPGWFNAIGARLVSGRLLDDRDRWDQPVAVVVDAALARAAWPGRDPLGQPIRVELFREGRFQPHWGEVVGVIESIRLTSLQSEGREQVYIAHQQSPQRTMYPAIKTAGDPLAMVPAVRDVVNRLQPGLPVFDVRTGADYVANAMAATRFALIGVGLFAAIVVLLAGFGLFAALAASVGQRRREIGVRLALGASPGAIFQSTMVQGLMPLVPGLIAGLVAAVGLSRVIESLLFGISSRDAATFAAVAGLLAGLAVVACWLPAARASRIDPRELLRSE